MRQYSPVMLTFIMSVLFFGLLMFLVLTSTDETKPSPYVYDDKDQQKQIDANQKRISDLVIENVRLSTKVEALEASVGRLEKRVTTHVDDVPHAPRTLR